MTRDPNPRGLVTLQEAAELSEQQNPGHGIGPAEVYRRFVRDPDPPLAVRVKGKWYIRRSEALTLTRRAPSTDERRAVQVRPKIDRYAAWEAEATRSGMSVGVWLLALADRASGWSEE